MRDGRAGPEFDAGIGFLERGCQGGDMLSCWTLGDIDYRGEGGRHDKARAARYFGVVCDHGGQEACRQLARMLSTGDGVPQDLARGKALLDGLCRRGDTQACSEVGPPPEANR